MYFQCFIYFLVEDFSEFYNEFSEYICVKWKINEDGGLKVGKK